MRIVFNSKKNSSVVVVTMFIAVVIKSVLLVLITYISFILNNSLSSFLEGELLVIIFLTYILNTFVVDIYKFMFTHPPGRVFTLLSFLVVLALTFTVPFFGQNFIIFFGWYISMVVFSVINRFSSYDDQLIAYYDISTTEAGQFSTQGTKGLICTEYTIRYATNLEVLASSDKSMLFDQMANHNGSITFGDTFSIAFQIKEHKFRYLPNSKEYISKKIFSLKHLLTTTLIEQQDE